MVGCPWDFLLVGSAVWQPSPVHKEKVLLTEKESTEWTVFAFPSTNTVHFPGSSASKEYTCNAENPSLIPKILLEEGIGYPL